MFGLLLSVFILVIGIALTCYCATYSDTYYETDRWGEAIKDESGERIIKKVETPYKKYAWTSMCVALILSLLILGISSAASIPTGHTGVLTTFGKVENKTLDAGMHFKLPWQSVVKMDNRVQKTTTQLSCFSSDIQEVSINYTLNYQIDKENAQELYKTVGKAYHETVIVPVIAESTKLVTAKYTAEELVGSRGELATKVEEVLRENLAEYNIQVVSTAIEDMDFTDAFTNAVEAKQVAAQNKLQAEIEQERKIMEQKASAEMEIINASAVAEKAKIEADAAEYAGRKEAEANKAISESITEDLLQYYYIQQWNGILPDTYVGSEDVSTIINNALKEE